jgi:hypothetical protein
MLTPTVRLVGYAQLYRGQKHATDLIDHVMASKYWNKTAIFGIYLSVAQIIVQSANHYHH